MFDDLIRRLDRIPKSQLIPIQIRLDDDGYLDRRYTAEECGAAFKVLFTDWREKVPVEQAWCAICGEVEDPQEFNTPDQERQIRDAGIAGTRAQGGRPGRDACGTWRRSRPRSRAPGRGCRSGP